ncbi:TonB-dependent receptor [Thalassotalea psychrophila]|uniref:TonB-dependent receptor n=1 Tax=Thalassotalea psychrophila TaxID=3065647 RepID=A0ABY9TXS0_9GAMM|nr:TonB-dependent receptor [Colwelliaceae bacterium SQ149]
MNLSLNKLTKAISLSLLTSSLLLSQVARAEAEQSVNEQEEQVEVDQVESNLVDESSKDEDIEVFQVTGSRINQTTLEGPLPVEVISAEDMLKAGNMSVYDALQNLSQNTGSVTGDENSNGFTPNAKVLNFRGLGPQYTLVLINGRRIANYPAAYNSNATVVNVNSVPMSAVERIEVVSTGASAIYGSDAAAAVINVILKKDFAGLSMGGTYGTPDNVDGDSGRFNIVKGFDFDNGNVTAVLEYSDSDTITGPSDMDYPFGTPVMSRGSAKVNSLAAQGYDAFYNNLPDNLRPDTYVDPGKDVCDSLLGQEYSYREQDEESSIPGSYGSYCGFDIGKRSTIRNGQEKISAMVSSNFDLDSDITVFADLIFTQIDAENDRGYINVQGVVEDPNSSAPIFEFGDGNNSILLPGNMFGYEHNLQTHLRLMGSEEIGNTATQFDETAYSFSVGAKGYVLDDYEWEVSYTQSQYQMDTERTLADHKMVEQYFLGEKVLNPDGGDLTYFGNPVYDGNSSHDVFLPLDQTAINDIFGRAKEQNETYSNMLTGVLSGDLFDVPAGTVQFAAVLEYMHEGFDYKADDKMLAQPGEGWWNFAGFGGEGDRDRYSTGLEVKVPLLDGLSLTGAVRYDEYHYIGKSNGDITPAISLEYRPLDDLLIRASYSGIFRAPDLQAVFTESSFYSGGTDWLGCYDQTWAPKGVTPEEFSNGPDAGIYQAACRSFSSTFKANKLPATDLENETGDSYGIGFVWEPVENFSIQFDYYETEINDQIQQASLNGILYDEFVCAYQDEVSDSVTFGCEKVNQLIIRKDSEDSEFSQSSLESVNTTPFNLAMHRQTGTDTKIKYSFDTSDFGSFNFGLSHTGIISTQRDTIEGDGTPPRELHDLLGNPEAIDTVIGSVGWYKDGLSASMNVRYKSGLGPRRPQPVQNADGNDALFDKDTGKEIDYVLDEDENPVDSEGEPIENAEKKTSQKRLDPYVTANLVLGYAFNEGDTRVNFTVNNVFDEKSPKDDTFLAHEWPWYNIGAYAGSAIGREFYLGFEHNF